MSNGKGQKKVSSRQKSTAENVAAFQNVEDPFVTVTIGQWDFEQDGVQVSPEEAGVRDGQQFQFTRDDVITHGFDPDDYDMDELLYELMDDLSERTGWSILSATLEEEEPEAGLNEGDIAEELMEANILAEAKSRGYNSVEDAMASDDWDDIFDAAVQGGSEGIVVEDEAQGEGWIRANSVTIGNTTASVVMPDDVAADMKSSGKVDSYLSMYGITSNMDEASIKANLKDAAYSGELNKEDVANFRKLGENRIADIADKVVARRDDMVKKAEELRAVGYSDTDIASIEASEEKEFASGKIRQVKMWFSEVEHSGDLDIYARDIQKAGGKFIGGQVLGNENGFSDEGDYETGVITVGLDRGYTHFQALLSKTDCIGFLNDVAIDERDKPED